MGEEVNPWYMSPWFRIVLMVALIFVLVVWLGDQVPEEQIP